MSLNMDTKKEERYSDYDYDMNSNDKDNDDKDDGMIK